MEHKKTKLSTEGKDAYESRAWAEVDLAALEHNIDVVRRALPDDVGIISVVKADAYGHGVGPIVERLGMLGLQGYAVSSPLEGAEVRAVGAEGPILVFGPVFPSDVPCILKYDLSVTVSSEKELEVLRAALSGTRKHVRVHLKVDTGMGRMGVPYYQEAVALFQALKKVSTIRLEGLYSHLASAGEQASVTELQRTRLLELIAELPSVSDLLVHVDNSAGATVFDASGPWNAVRLGLMQYGCEPYDNTGFVLKPVLSAHARVGLVKSLRQGSAISYGGTHCLTRDSKVAIVTVGYADGLSRQLSNRGSMLIRGVRCPILGRVCMDLTILDVTDHPETIAPGDRVTWIGAQEAESIRVEELSHWAGTIPWECLCSLSRRVPRVYVG